MSVLLCKETVSKSSVAWWQTAQPVRGEHTIYGPQSLDVFPLFSVIICTTNVVGGGVSFFLSSTNYDDNVYFFGLDCHVCMKSSFRFCPSIKLPPIVCTNDHIFRPGQKWWHIGWNLALYTTWQKNIISTYYNKVARVGLSFVRKVPRDLPEVRVSINKNIVLRHWWTYCINFCHILKGQ